MDKQQKTNLKLPIFLTVGPSLAIILSIIIYAIINFAASSTATSDSVSLYGDQSLVVTISNIFLFLTSAVAMLALIPCLVFGIILLNKRRAANHLDTATSSRQWEDIE